MKALIAFIILGIFVATLIEINERVKTKKSHGKETEAKDDCAQKEAGDEACSACELMSVCEKRPETKTETTPAP